MTEDLDFHIKRLEEALTLIRRAANRAAKGIEAKAVNPELGGRVLEAILACLEDAENILIEQLDKLEA